MSGKEKERTDSLSYFRSPCKKRQPWPYGHTPRDHLRQISVGFGRDCPIRRCDKVDLSESPTGGCDVVVSAGKDGARALEDRETAEDTDVLADDETAEDIKVLADDETAGDTEVLADDETARDTEDLVDDETTDDTDVLVRDETAEPTGVFL